MGKGGCSKKEVGSPSQGCANEENKDKKEEENKSETTATISFRIAVFYDGTGNNKLNTAARRIADLEDSKMPFDDSFESNESEKKFKENAIEEIYTDTLNAYQYLPKKEIENKIEEAKRKIRTNKKEYEKSEYPVSYLGAETNVYKMFRNLEKCKKNPVPKENKGDIEWGVFNKFYIEGIGTSAGLNDDFNGGAYGLDKTGIKNRVYDAKNLVIDFIRKKN